VTEATLLRVATTVAAASGTLSLGAQGQLRPLVAACALVLVVAAGAAPQILRDGRARKQRRSAAKALVLGATVLSAVVLLGMRARSGFGDTTDLVHQVGTTISLPLVVVLVAQLASADSLRELRVVLVASLTCGLLAVGTAEGGGAQKLLSSLGFFLLLGWTAALLSLWLLQRVKYQQAADAVHLGRVLGDRRHLGALVVGSTLIGLASVVLLPHPAGWHPLDLDRSASGPGSPLEDSNAAGGQAAERDAADYLRGDIDLNSRGDLATTRLVSVPADSPRLWAGSVLYTYNGRFWGPSDHPLASLILPTDAAGDFDPRPGATSGGEPARAARSDTVRLLDTGTRLPVIAPGQAVAIHLAGRVARLTAETLLPLGSPTQPTSYVVRSNPVISDAVTPEDTELPASVPSRVRALAHRITRNAPTAEVKVAAIERYLHAHEVYRLDSAVPAAGTDAVDQFLFVSHEGFCEHFASAEIVLLRAVGVPARLVTGFTNGEDHGTRRVFRGTDAHAWVQVGVGGQRWVFSDPTAGAVLAPDHQSWLGRFASAMREQWQVALGCLASLLLFTALIALGARRLRARRARRASLDATIDDQVLAAFARLEKALAGIGFSRSHEVSIHEQTTALLADWPGGLPDATLTQAAMVVVERVLYDAEPVPDDAALAAVSTLDQLTETARAAQPVARN
jgi:protein-glutamine gamma-glutamyltransferase